ncbi:MFS transporter [Streptomyces heilongjiangensis]|uniref:MFS transporter n=1 Tax=Streptomyces heilongjiangensis TaxID=945052 RepID=A0ABW1B4I0_9ACTN|nr:MFS transporter [Streptomyces heilongjiangensis]MDC2948252.1 MFS transporter [Streptomyces heilongjiangensis]
MTGTETADPRRWWILGVLSLALFAIVLNNGLLNVAIPQMMRSLDADVGQIQFIVDGYALALAGALLTAGTLSDRYGHKRATLLGTTVFGVGSLVGMTADGTGQLIGARVLMGLGAACIMPGTLAVLVDVFPPAERARAIGVWSGCSALGVAAGPVVGGALVSHFWWGSIFLVNLVPVAVVLVAGALLLPESADPSPRRPDPVGALLGTGAMVGLVFGTIQAAKHGWTSTGPVTGFTVAAVAGVCFVLWERRHPSPMVDFALLRRAPFIGASVSILLLMFGLAGTLFVLTQRLQFAFGYGPLRAGLAVMPVAFAVLLGTVVCPALVRRAGPGGSVAVGLALGAAGVLVLGRVGEGYAPVLAGLVLAGIGFGLAMGPTTDVVMSLVPPERSGATGSLDMTMQEFGNALGVAVVGSVLAHSYTNAMTDAGRPRAARRTLESALALAERTGGDAGQVLAAAARSAFDHAAGVGLTVAAAGVAVGSVVAALLMPGRAGVGGTSGGAGARADGTEAPGTPAPGSRAPKTPAPPAPAGRTPVG